MKRATWLGAVTRPLETKIFQRNEIDERRKEKQGKDFTGDSQPAPGVHLTLGQNQKHGENKNMNFVFKLMNIKMQDYLVLSDIF